MNKLDLIRFKKTMAGLIEFATLLEQASDEMRDKIIREVEEIDRLFIKRALRKTVFYEELLYLDESILSEILSKVSPMILAFSLRGMPEEFRTHILKHLSYRGTVEVRDEEERITHKTSLKFVEGARRQVLKIARDLEKQNRFVFELVDCPRFNPTKRRAVGYKKS